MFGTRTCLVASFIAAAITSATVTAEDQRTVQYYVYGAPLVSGTQLYTPLQLQPLTLQVQSAASVQSQDVNAQGLETLLVDLLGRVLGGIIDREFPANPNPNQPGPAAKNCTQLRLKAIEEFLKNGASGTFTPADCKGSGSGRNGTSDGLEDLDQLPTAAAAGAESASELSSKIDLLSTRIEGLTAAINNLAETKNPPTVVPPAPASDKK